MSLNPAQAMAAKFPDPEYYLHEFQVEMTCEGCEAAVRRVITRLGDKVNHLEIDLAAKKVSISAPHMGSDDLLEVIKRTGKEVKYLGTKPGIH